MIDGTIWNAPSPSFAWQSSCSASGSSTCGRHAQCSGCSCRVHFQSMIPMSIPQFQWLCQQSVPARSQGAEGTEAPSKAEHMSLALFAHHGDDTLTWFLTVFEGSRSVQKECCRACRDGHVFDASTSGSISKEHGFTIVFSRSCRAHVLAICSETSLFSVTCTPTKLGGLCSGVVQCGVRSVEVLNKYVTIASKFCRTLDAVRHFCNSHQSCSSVVLNCVGRRVVVTVTVVNATWLPACSEKQSLDLHWGTPCIYIYIYTYRIISWPHTIVHVLVL